MAMTNAPIPAGEIASLAASLSNSQEILKSKIQFLEERIAGISRPSSPPMDRGNTAAGPGKVGPVTNHGLWLSDMVANADMMANHVQSIIDRIEL